MRRFFPIVLLLILVTAASAQFTYTEVTCPNNDWRVGAILGINNAGTMVGGYFTDADPTWHALLVQNGKCSAIAPGVLSTKSSWADAINDQGEITGSYSDTNVFALAHGFLLRKTGEFITLDFPAADGTWSYKINESGTIVGKWVITDSLGNPLAWHGYLWKDGQFSDVLYPGAADTLSLGINSRGDHVGYWDPNSYGSVWHAYHSSKGTLQTSDMPDNPGTMSTAINDAGAIVGQVTDALGGTHGYLQIGSKFVQLDFPGAAFTGFEGVNNKGQMVGWFYDQNYAIHGMLVEPTR